MKSDSCVMCMPLLPFYRSWNGDSEIRWLSQHHAESKQKSQNSNARYGKHKPSLP